MSANQAALDLTDQTSAPGQPAGADSEAPFARTALGAILRGAGFAVNPDPRPTSRCQIQSSILNPGLRLHQGAAGRSRAPSEETYGRDCRKSYAAFAAKT